MLTEQPAVPGVVIEFEEQSKPTCGSDGITVITPFTPLSETAVPVESAATTFDIWMGMLASGALAASCTVATAIGPLVTGVWFMP